MATGTKSKKRPAPKPEPEVAEDDLELEDLDEDIEEEAAPASKKKSDEVEFGASDLAAHLSKITGKTIKPRDLRTLIRKMAREDTPRIKREITQGNRSRYNWAGGLEHPEVKAIVAAVTGGELEQGKKEALEKLKRDKAAKSAAKKKAAAVDEVEDEELEEVDDDE